MQHTSFEMFVYTTMVIDFRVITTSY